MIENDEKLNKRSSNQFYKEFKIKKLGKLRYFLGIEVAYSTQRIFFSYRKYMLDLIINLATLGSKPLRTPIDPNHIISHSKEGKTVVKGEL